VYVAEVTNFMIKNIVLDVLFMTAKI